MCWICDAKTDIAEGYWAQKLGVSTAHFQAASTNLAYAFPVDGVGDIKTATPSTGLIVTADEAGDSIGSNNPELVVGAPSGVATINMIGDQDYFRIELEAGKLYEIGQYAKVGGPNGVPLSDAYIELYDAAGNLLVSADGGGPNTPSGLDALLSYEAQATGTYYVNFRSYDNAPEDGDDGDVVGDYEYFAREVDPNDPNVYRPYYDADNPLYALDWGSQVDGTVRNPDGAESGHITGNPAETPDNKGEEVGHFGQSTEGKNVIKIYFAKAGDVYTPEDPTSPGIPPAIVAVGAKDFEMEAVWTSLREFEKVADVVYVETQNRDEADFHYVTYTGTPGPGVSLLGSMSPPNEPDEGLAQFNSGDERWNETNLAQGGFSFVTLIHEFGHGHGMSHPHDGGGRSGVMRGVEEEGVAFDYTTGDFELNQGVFTMMSYEDGWQSSPYGNAPTDVGYGYLGGLMAFDIAVIQDKYGVNEEWATGNDTYRLKDVNAPGTFFYSIWDAGGTDRILYTGDRNANINLLEATLKYEAGGGGWVSYADGIHGGFTIANGVTIENAISGGGNDTLKGNGARNSLRANDGHDTLYGFDGNDVMYGGAGNDVLYGHSGRDTLYGGIGDDVVYGGDWNDTMRGGKGADYLNGGRGDDVMKGGDGADRLLGSLGADVMNGGAGADLFVYDNASADGSRDVIEQFSRADGDKIDLSAIDANPNAAGNQAFTFVGSNAFSGAGGEVRMFMDADGNKVASGDVDGDKVADIQIAFVDPVQSVGAADFIF